MMSDLIIALHPGGLCGCSLHPRATTTKAGSKQEESQLLFCQWMPDDPTPFIQKEAVVPEVRAGEERLQIIDLILLGLGQQV
jgi:hypothetical protein